MAKKKGKSKGKKSADREFVWLQCTESGDLNYRTSLRVKGGIADKMKAGLKKYRAKVGRADGSLRQ
ncbi:MAG: hypothetical protein ACYTAU_20960 [Planctomycetota bacterium]|jgi:large subunit ribosomal protein L33